MDLTLTSALSVLAPILVIIWIYLERKAKMSILKRCGIPGPTPHILWGNMREYYDKPNVVWDTDLIIKYGPIVGYYLGAKPFVLIADPDLLYLIQSKESSNFLDRPRKVPGGINPDPKRALMLGNLSVPEWKHVRKLVSPTFSPKKLKEMLPKISYLTDKMLQKLKCEEQIDFYALFQSLTLDIISTTAFGVESNIQDNPNDPLLKAVMAEFSKTTNSTLVKLHLCFPEISAILHPIRKLYQWLKTVFQNAEASALWKHGRNVLSERRGHMTDLHHQGTGCDLLQLLIKSDLSDDQIVANSVLFFEAAYETLSGSLGFITHLLVNNSVVQDKLREELEDFVQEYGKLDAYDVMTKLKYLDAVIKEGLRLFPPQTTFIGRSPLQDFSYTKDAKTYTFGKGVHIQVGLFQIQNSPQNWLPDASVFRPERFEESLRSHSKKNITWQPFGLGPRECIGARFADLTLKLVLAKLIHGFELIRCSKTEEKVKIEYKVATMTPKNGSWAIPITTNDLIHED